MRQNSFFTFLLSLICILFCTNSAFAAPSSQRDLNNPGLILKLGLGYGTVRAFDVAPVVGYQFNKYFELDAETIIRIGNTGADSPDPVYGFDMTLTPTFVYAGKSGILHLGLGLGYDKYRKKIMQEDELYSPVDKHTTQGFLIKPTIGVDHYFTDSFFLSFSLDVPVYIGETKKEETKYFNMHLSNGNKLVKNKKTTEYEKTHGARFDILIAFGWKFSSK